MNKMKNIIRLAILLISFTASAQLGNLKKSSNNQLYWSKIYDEVLDIKSQEIDLTGGGFKDALYIRDLKTARMRVEVNREGKTRVIVDKISSQVQLIDDESEDISAIVINRKKGTFKKFFINRDAKKIDDIISRAVESLIEMSVW